jgi:hypothetical protein
MLLVKFKLMLKGFDSVSVLGPEKLTRGLGVGATKTGIEEITICGCLIKSCRPIPRLAWLRLFDTYRVCEGGLYGCGDGGIKMI